MSTYSPRQMEILAQVRENGTAGIDYLSREFAVSTQTIRRDVNQLCEFGELRRVRGGVTLPPPKSHTQLSINATHLSGKYHELASRVASHIPDHSSLAIVSSPLMILVIQALREKSGLKIFTNDLAVALLASHQKDWQIVIAGGLVVSPKSEEAPLQAKPVSGSKIADFFARFEADFGLIQATAISPQGMLLETAEEEAEIIQTVLSHANNGLLLLDSDQLDRSAHVRAGDLNQIDRIFSNKTHDNPTKDINSVMSQPACNDRYSRSVSLY